MDESKAGPSKGIPESRLDVMIQDDAERNVVVVSLAGRLDVFTYRDMARRVETATAGRQGLGLVFNLAGVSMVTSSGWSAFLATRARLKREGGRLALACMNPDLTRVYETMKTAELVPAFDNVEAALAAVR